jgi:tetratricopeptide (TPR) repeat protein
LLVAGIGLGGCAAEPLTLAADPVELTDVPFFAQADFDCGPAALATILADTGVPVTADDLMPAVYVEGLHGSLQAELMAAARRYGRIPYRVHTDPQSLSTELGAGRPVLVLQNLGLPRAPVWHYAVVVGIDPVRGRIVLRSGDQARRVEPIRRFLRQWRRAGRWGIVAVEAGVLPATATPHQLIRAIVDAGRYLTPAGRDAAYRSALERWSDDVVVLFAAAANDYEQGRLNAAAALYRRLLAMEPADAAAHNNLANVLLEQGRREEALAEARAALSGLTPNDPLYDAVQDTLRHTREF